MIDDKTPQESLILKFPGVRPDAPTETGEGGGKQSVCGVSLAEGFPAAAVLQIGAIVDAGRRKYGADNWRKIKRADHINHALMHLLAFVAGDRQDDHLGHAACRALMAMETE